MKNKFISVIIVNYNGEKWLKRCLTSLTNQTYRYFEIIFVDNASTDRSVNFVKKYFPKVNIIRNQANLGFAGGNNVGIRQAKGEYLLILNNDIFCENDFLEKLVKSFTDCPSASLIQPKIVLMDNPKLLDCAGSFWTDSTFLYHHGYQEKSSLPVFNQSYPVFSLKGAAMLIKRQVFEKTGLFDHDFWCYYEETDYCHRAWLAGFECWYYPKATVYHAVGGTTKKQDAAFLQFYNFKNKLLSFLKNWGGVSLISIIPTFLTMNVGVSFYWLIQGRGKHFLSIYRAFWWNLIHLNQTMKKRRQMQKLRVKSDREILKWTKRNPSINYYRQLIRNFT